MTLHGVMTHEFVEARKLDVDLIVHRDGLGEIVAAHTPLAEGTVQCGLCELGVPVRVGSMIVRKVADGFEVLSV